MSDLIPSPEEYFRNLLPDRDPMLTEMEEEARRQGIPIVGPMVGRLLFVLAWATQARNILELGTATGYSTIYLARGCEAVFGHMVTVEKDAVMADQAEANFRRAGITYRVKVERGDARKKLIPMRGPFDMIFMDIDKEHYHEVLPECERLLKLGGLLVVDNVAFADAEPFNRLIMKLPQWKPVHLFGFLPFHSPEHDGLCLAVRT